MLVVSYKAVIKGDLLRILIYDFVLWSGKLQNTIHTRTHRQTHTQNTNIRICMLCAEYNSTQKFTIIFYHHNVLIIMIIDLSKAI